MNNRLAVRLQSGEAAKPNTSINSGMIATAAKAFNEESDDSNVIDVINDKDIIILNDSEFSLVPTSSPGDLVNYDQIDRIDPVIITAAKNDTPTSATVTSTSTTQPPVPTTSNNHLPPQPTSSTCTASNDHPTLPSSSIFSLPANPLVPISTTVTTNAQNETVTTTNYEIVNPVSIPDVSGGEEGPLFAGVFDATFSDEQMQQLLDATEITVANGGDGVAAANEGIQQAQSLQICNSSSSTSHQAFKDITNTHHNGAVNTNNPNAPSGHGLQFCLDGTPNGYLTTPTATLGIAENAFGTEPMDGLTDYSMFIKTEGLPSLDDFDVPHFIKQRYVDGKQAKIWQCGVCEKEFGHQYVLMRHLPTHTDERKFQCTVCGKAFRQMSTLSQHRAIHSADRPYICEICEKTFNRVSTLISHRKTHTGLKPHQCHLCNKAFHQKGNLRNHIFTHTNERPYKCDVCNKGFNQMSNLMCHKLKAHKRADKPKYNCQTCGKEFQKRMSLRNHEQYEHGDNGSGAGGNPAQRIKYTNGVLIDRINTAAMQLAIDTNEIPFALLRPLNGIPVLVRALPAGEKQLLVPATADDLKRHGHITIGGKPNILRVNQENNVLKQGGNLVDIKAVDNDNKENKNSKVQIRIPVVATVVQRMDKDGVMRMDVQSPGPTPIENYVPNEMITQMEVAKPFIQNETNQEHCTDVVNVETHALLKPEPTTQVPSTDDNMDVEEPSNSSNRIIERSLAKTKTAAAMNDDDSVICDYFDLTTNASDTMNDDDIKAIGGADAKKAVDQFDSGVFVGGDRDQSYCEIFEILRKDDDIAAIDLTEDDNPVAF